MMLSSVQLRIKAGTDCIMIHSKEKNPKQIFEFSQKFLKTKFARPLVAVPSTYSKTYERELIKNGFNVVICKSFIKIIIFLNG